MKNEILTTAFLTLINKGTGLNFSVETQCNDETDRLEVTTSKSIITVFVPDMEDYNTFTVKIDQQDEEEFMDEVDSLESSDLREIINFIENYNI
ncbi:hypothetical protein [Sphingobacterium mizutaii]|uniref:hypothetical protein n=1 Tax=Sphingobacterium mizutaii TaxID=1010 RepID=UPI00289ACF55|nr:hypothetical protein [Sphingobacterium mizutaii]